MDTPTDIRILNWSDLDVQGRLETLARPAMNNPGLEKGVAEIIGAIRSDGDAALLRLTRQLDNAELDELAVDDIELETATQELEPELLKAMDNAMGRIRSFHGASAPIPIALNTAEGLRCETRYRPISPVGLYVPGGSAPLVSTLMMLSIPAKLAGCEEIVLCTPPSEDGSVHPAILAAALRCGVRQIYKCGGAQAIAAMAYGTETVPKCAKIFGPGNAWVTEAKRQVSSQPDGAAQDMPAGPSEVLVIADAGADPQSVAWDLLSQAEHGPDSQALLISDDINLLKAVAEILPQLAGTLPRSEILSSSLGFARLIQVGSIAEAIDISNEYAPEHLILNCTDADDLVNSVTAAGSVFVGPWTPESLGDYCSGTNHVLPTYGYARAYSGLSVNDFQRRMTVQSASFEGLKIAGPDAMALAGIEGLDAHRMAVEYRLGSGKTGGSS